MSSMIFVPTPTNWKIYSAQIDVFQADVELFAREPNLTVDSELVPLERRGKVVIERLNASEKPQIRLAHR